MVQKYYSSLTTDGTLGAPASSGATSLTVDGFTNPPNVPFTMSIDKDTASHEIVLVTAVAGSTFTVTRAQDGTSAASHSSGAECRHVVPASTFNEIEAHINAVTGVHGTTGEFVDTDSAQTVTNKTVEDSNFESAHSGSPAGSAAFKVNADTAAAKDGFVVDSTGGDAARSGFRVSVSGGDRFKVSNAGNVTIDAVSGTDLTVNGIASITGNTTVGGTLGVTGALSSGTQTVTGGVTASGTVQGANVTATGDLSVGDDATITGDATVGGTLGVTGAATLGSTLASGNHTVTGTSSVSGASTAASYTATGAGSFHSAGVVTAQVSSTHHRVDSKIPLTDGNVTRSVRQPVVHEAEGEISVTPGASEGNIFTFSWTQKETGQVKFDIVGLAVRTDGGAAGTTGETFMRVKLTDTSGGTSRYDSGIRWAVAATNATFDVAPITQYTIAKAVDDYVFVAGTGYTLTLSGLKGAAAADIRHMRYDVAVTEIACV